MRRCSSRATILRQKGWGLSENSITRSELNVAYAGAKDDSPEETLLRVSVFPAFKWGRPAGSGERSVAHRSVRNATTNKAPMAAIQRKRGEFIMKRRWDVRMDIVNLTRREDDCPSVLMRVGIPCLTQQPLNLE